MFAQHELGCFLPLRGMFPTVFDQTRGMSIHLVEHMGSNFSYANTQDTRSCRRGNGTTLEQLSHVKIVPRLRTDLIPLMELEERGVFDGGEEAERWTSSTLAGSGPDVPLENAVRGT